MDVLPPELIRQCLLRVSYSSHPNLAAVCRSWRAMVKSPQFYEDRKKFGISQQCICLIGEYHHVLQNRISVYDPVQGTLEQLPRLPHFPGDHQGIPDYCHRVCVNRKLVLIGGLNPNDQKRIHNVFIYDFSSAKWTRGTDTPLPAIGSACAVSPEGLVYVAGGRMDRNENAVGGGAAVYNVEKDEWKLLPEMKNQQWNFCFGAFIDGKFFVMGLWDVLGGGAQMDAQVYDPEKRVWTTIPNMFRASKGCAGTLYLFKNEQGLKVYDSRENVWRSVTSLPSKLGTITCCTPWRDRIFVGAVESSNVFYMWKPPHKECGAELSQDEVVGELSVLPITMDCDHFNGSAVTFEI